MESDAPSRSTVGPPRRPTPAPAPASPPARFHPDSGGRSTIPDESDLLRRLRSGDEAAYERLVRDLTPRLLAVARRIARSESDAEDAVQEAFLSAFKAIATFDGRSSLSTWLHRIVTNAALMKVRKDKTRREAPIENLLPQFDADGHHTRSPHAWPGVTHAGDDGIELPGGVAKAQLWEAMAALPEEFRDVILMRDVEGMESKAVATALGISDALVRQRLHRGRQALMKLLEPLMAGARDTGEARR